MADDSQAHDLPPDGLLRAAARLVQRAIDKMDLSHERCRSCGSVKHHHKGHYKAWTRISEIPARLNEVADHISEQPQARQEEQ